MNRPDWHEPAWKRLQARRQCGALPRALLLAGASGLGKRVFLERFVHGLLCEQPREGDACGRCRCCLLLAAGTHPDRVLVSPGLRKDGVARREIVVDQIRQLTARMATSSQFGSWQIASIDPADAMNVAAANALLKTLEEPSQQTMLVLVADAPWRLPPTIRSRCQRIEFNLPPREQALAWLDAEGVTEATSALTATGGNPGLARDWSREGMLAWRMEVQHDLKSLAAGHADAMEVAGRWLGSDPSQRLWFAAQVVVDELKRRCSGGQTSPWVSGMDDDALWRWYNRANHARDALRGPLRDDLLLIELLDAWH